LEALGKPGSGYSAENLVLGARGDDGSYERLVLRRDTSEAPIYPSQSPGTTTGVLLQHAVMDAVRRCGRVPVAESLGLESDPSVLGAPFFVMRYVAGDVLGEDPPYTRRGFFVEASPAERRRLVTEGLETLARVHETNLEDPGLTSLHVPGVRPGAARQLEIWEGCLREGLVGRSSPLFERCLEWLHAGIPEEPPSVLSWGDSRPGNMIWQDFRVACITDFEGAAIGPRELDVGWWLMFDRWMHEASGVARLAGEPDRSEQQALYEAAAGVSVGSTIWYEVFSALRFATTVVQVMNRWVARGAVPEDQTIWRDNPATAVMSELLDELST
jgi:aminoglycoside phosphotransferase (APT) family kinase protein